MAVKVVDISADYRVLEEQQHTIGVAEGLAPEDMIRIVHGSDLCHVVQKDSLFFDHEVAAARRMIEDARAFLAYPAEAILNLSTSVLAESAEYKSLKLQIPATERKSSVLKQFEEFLSQLPGTHAIRDQAYTVADELFTNAAKNAWPNGDRTLQPLLLGGLVEFFAHADRERLIIGCRDTYGLLGFSTVLERIHLCYSKGVAESMHQGGSGAGIGSFMVFNSGISYYAGVDPGRCSVVCVVLPLGLSARKAAKLSKNIHLVSVK